MAHGSSVTPSITWQQDSSVATVKWWFDTSASNTSVAASSASNENTAAGFNSGAVFYYAGTAPATPGTYYGKMGFYDSSGNLLGAFVTQAIAVT
jgi:hypothetical protein